MPDLTKAWAWQIHEIVYLVNNLKPLVYKNQNEILHKRLSSKGVVNNKTTELLFNQQSIVS